MKFSRYTDKKLILTDLLSNSKEEAIGELIELMAKNKVIKDREGLLRELLERERVETTGIGDGIAVPHVRSACTKKIGVALGITKAGIEFSAMDGKKVNLIFLVVGPEDDNETYLKAMAAITRVLSSSDNRRRLIEASSPKEAIELIKEMES
ncbi:PTS sugar transporter subunit IIA [bacterium]|nr:PTS sugar transporter subunit IIA [bacterium]